MIFQRKDSRPIKFQVM